MNTDLFCDFCHRTDIQYRYECPDFVAIIFTGQGEPWKRESIGDWAACVACTHLIETNDKAGLLERAVHQDDEFDEEEATAVRPLMAQWLDAFWQYHTGGPIKL